jgi:hypothetical protein
LTASSRSDIDQLAAGFRTDGRHNLAPRPPGARIATGLQGRASPVKTLQPGRVACGKASKAAAQRSSEQLDEAGHPHAKGHRRDGKDGRTLHILLVDAM